MMPDRHNFREKSVKKRTSGGWIVQIAIILLVGAVFLAWETPIYWAHRLMPSSTAAKSKV